MLFVAQVLAFTACCLASLLPSTQVECGFSAPVAALSSPPAPPPPARPPEATVSPAGTTTQV